MGKYNVNFENLKIASKLPEDHQRALCAAIEIQMCKSVKNGVGLDETTVSEREIQKIMNRDADLSLREIKKRIGEMAKAELDNL